jgi:FG-GAP-like repeat/PQQ enzyme repeat
LRQVSTTSESRCPPVPATAAMGRRLLAVFLTLSFVLPCAAQVSILTHHNDNLRTGSNLNETTLNTSNVNASTFGKLFCVRIDGYLYAQPLYLPNVTMVDNKTHNVLFVATAHDSIYALDANSGSPVWKISLGTPVPSGANGIIPTGNIQISVGIVSTPVIDPSTKTLYVVAKTYESGVQYFRLHALDVTSGAEKLGGPAQIQGQVSGLGYDNVSGVISFTASKHNQRPALTLANGVIYIAFASYDDEDPYHGWVFAYSASTLQQLGLINMTPNVGRGGIWMAGQGPVADSSGNVYFLTGNSTTTSPAGAAPIDYGNSFIRVAFQNGALAVLDYFTPTNYESLNANDQDVGSGGPVGIPGTMFIVGGGKQVYHAYFCSTPTGGGGETDLDDIRHISSTDLINWSAPDDLLHPNTYERSNCDPSVVFFNAGDGPYYYLFYGGNVATAQTVMFVARSASPDGPFLKLTDRNTWEVEPPDPHVIIWPIQRIPDPGNGIYGAGQPSVVVKNGVLYMWYMDDTQTLPATQIQRIYVRYSSDGKSWSSPALTNVLFNNSVEVKLDPVTNLFVMFEIDNQFAASSLVSRTSPDGVFTWSNENVLCDASCFPPGASNPGVSSDDQGNLLDSQQTMVGYGAPYVLNHPSVWGQWDLYGSLFLPSQVYVKNEPDLFVIKGDNTGTNSTEVHILSGASVYQQYSLDTGTPLATNDGTLDYELANWSHGGSPDLAVVKKSNTASGKTEVQILSGASAYQTSIVHVATAMGPTDSTYQFQFVDWDGDGIPDLAMIKTSNTASGNTEIHILSGASGFQTYILNVATAFGSFTANANFYLFDWDHDGKPDLALVLGGNTGSGNKEVHILSAASGFQQYLAHAVTALTGNDGPFQFQFTDFNGDGVRDLIAIKQNNTGSNTTEVHILSGAVGFTQFLGETATALPPTDSTFKLLMPLW